MIQIIKFPFDDKAHLKQAFAIRSKVFVEEQQVNPTLEYDEYEEISNHYLLFSDGEPAGVARWRHTSGGIKLERFAVLPHFRGKGLGDALVKRVLDDVVPFAKQVYLHAQLKACSLYGRNGFVEVGDIFIEADIEHYKMIYQPKHP